MERAIEMWQIFQKEIRQSLKMKKETQHIDTNAKILR